MDGNRRVEVVSFICVACIIVVGTIAAVTWQYARLSLYSQWCGQDVLGFSMQVEIGNKFGSVGFKTGDGQFVYLDSLSNDKKPFFKCPCKIKSCSKPSTKGEKPLCYEVAISSLSSLKYFDPNLLTFSLNGNKVGHVNLFIKQGRYCAGRDKWYTDKKKIYLSGNNMLLRLDRDLSLSNQSPYCMKSFENENTVGIIECAGPTEQGILMKMIHIVKASAMFLSVPFLVATIVVYALVAELRNLHGKALMCHMACLTVAYVAMGLLQMKQEEQSYCTKFCTVLAFVFQFSFVACFFWLNVTCFDIWWIFSGASSNQPRALASIKREQKRFFHFSIYAWGGPLLITIFSAIMDIVPWTSRYLVKPRFGNGGCWFYSESIALYVYMPVGVLLSINLMMFSTTAYRLRTQACSSSVLRRRNDHPDRQNFKLYFKLFFIMGLNWSLELLSFLSGGYELFWFVADLCNTLQGLTIFLLFVCKRRIFTLLRQKFQPALEENTTRNCSRRTLSSMCFSQSDSINNTSGRY